MEKGFGTRLKFLLNLNYCHYNFSKGLTAFEANKPIETILLFIVNGAK